MQNYINDVIIDLEISLYANFQMWFTHAPIWNIFELYEFLDIDTEHMLGIFYYVVIKYVIMFSLIRKFNIWMLIIKEEYYENTFMFSSN